MLLSVVFSLQPHTGSTLPVFHGEQAHAAAYRALKEQAPDLAEQLHSSTDANPFTVSRIRPPVSSNGDVWNLDANQICEWRLTALNGTLARHLLDIAETLEWIEIAGAYFHVVETAIQSSDHPEAGMSSAKNIQCRWRDAEPLSELTLAFVSPVTFKANGTYDPLPSPRHVFGSLADALDVSLSAMVAGGSRGLFREDADSLMNTWRDDEKRRPRSLRDVFESGVTIVGGQGEFAPMHLPDVSPVGFCGEMTYRVRVAMLPLQRILSVLADVAFYSGVGALTGYGFGQTRLV